MSWPKRVSYCLWVLALHFFPSNCQYWLAKSTYDWISLEACPYNERVLESIQDNLSQHIGSQDEALAMIYNAFASWEMEREEARTPLVMAFTGSSGVGKSETALRVAEGMLMKRMRIGATNKLLPKGSFFIRGEEFTNTSEIVLQSIGYARDVMKNRIVSHLLDCEGKALIILDEVQKVAPGVLDFLIPAFEDRGSLSYDEELHDTSYLKSAFTIAQSTIQDAATFWTAAPSGTSVNKNRNAGTKKPVNYKTKQVSTSDAVFILISDIGLDAMLKTLILHGGRSSLPHSELRNSIKLALDEQWKRLKLGRMIKEVVPFMPLESSHMQDILRLKFRHLAVAHRNSSWLDIAVDDEALSYFVGAPFVRYTTVNMQTKQSSSTNNDTSDYPLSSASSGLLRYATWGARSLENAGPLRDIRSMLNRYMQPWRPSEIVHIGLVNESDKARQQEKWGPVGNKDASGASRGRNQKFVYFQWCKFHPAMIATDESESAYVPEGEEAAELSFPTGPSQESEPTGDAEEDETCSQNSSASVEEAPSRQPKYLDQEDYDRFFHTKKSSSRPFHDLVITDGFTFSATCETIKIVSFPP